jgi:hypothetical protein
MTDPPGMVVGISGRFGDVLFSLWNYTDGEIEVNVEAEAVPLSAPQPVVGGGNPVFSRRAPSSAEALNRLSGGVGMLTTPAILCW